MINLLRGFVILNWGEFTTRGYHIYLLVVIFFF